MVEVCNALAAIESLATYQKPETRTERQRCRQYATLPNHTIPYHTIVQLANATDGIHACETIGCRLEEGSRLIEWLTTTKEERKARYEQERTEAGDRKK